MAVLEAEKLVWEEASGLGEQLVREGFLQAIAGYRAAGDEAGPFFALSLGCIREIGRIVRLSVTEDKNSTAYVEAFAVAVLRGAIRQSGHPVKDDGTPFTGVVFDA